LVIEVALDEVGNGVFFRLRGFDTNPKGWWTAKQPDLSSEALAKVEG
jgi:hypothetical protein